ncbi:MAG: hypothetical protein ACRDNL_09505 [Spirillospora sp.]
MSPKAAESLESGGKDCAGEITKLGLRPGGITAVQVWGERAQARLSDQIRLRGAGLMRTVFTVTLLIIVVGLLYVTAAVLPDVPAPIRRLAPRGWFRCRV